MSKPKMANSLQRILVLATVVAVIMFAGTCEAEKPQHSGAKNPGVLPVSKAKVGGSGQMDANGRSTTQGVVGFISPLYWPVTITMLKGFNFILRIFFGQTLPCTVWSMTPPKMECTMLE